MRKRAVRAAAFRRDDFPIRATGADRGLTGLQMLCYYNESTTGDAVGNDIQE